MSDTIDFCMLFDSDGTLVDSEVINTRALADELALHNINEHATELLTRYKGWQFKAVVADLDSRHKARLNKHALGKNFEMEFRSRASRYFSQELQPIRGIEAALQQLSFRKCVVSNAPMDKLTQVLEKTNLIQYFNGHLFSAYDISIFKPDPGLFLHAAKSMGYKANQCIVIEDSFVGVEAAIAAQMNCVWYCAEQQAVAESPTISAAVEQKKVLMIDSMIDLPGAIQAFRVS